MRLATEDVTCDACGSTTTRTIATEAYRLHDSEVELKVVRCNRCRLTYTSPRLDQESTFLMYSHDAGQTISGNYCWSGDHSKARFLPLVSRLRELCPDGQLLDVGCGSGDFLRVAGQEASWDVVGIEPVRDAALTAQAASGATVHNCVLEEAPFEAGSLSIVSMLGVLEHVHSPTAILSRVRHLLKPGGLLAIYVPNFHYLRLKDTGPFCYLRRGRWSDLHPQEHQFHFTKTTLCSTLERCGYEVLRVDVGQPFAVGSKATRMMKQGLSLGVQMLWKLAGIHLGGLEVIARVADRPAKMASPQEAKAA